GVRVRPDRGVRRVPADDQPPPQGAARGGPADVAAARNVGVLPGAAAGPGRAGRAAGHPHRTGASGRARGPAGADGGRGGDRVNPPDVGAPALWRRLLAELVGTGLLVTVVVGSG